MSVDEYIKHLRELKELAALGGGEKLNEAQKAKGKMTARERFSQIVFPTMGIE